MSAILFIVSGCASTGGQGVAQTSQPASITAINIADNQISIVADKPFVYTVYKSSDPYKVIVEFPDMRLGNFTDKIKSDKAGITEIAPSQVEEPLSAKLEILLSSPVGVEPSYKDAELVIKVKEEPGAQKAEEVGAHAEKGEEQAKETKLPEAGKPEQKAAVPTAEVKEEIAAPKPEPKIAASKELPAATAIVHVNIEKGEDVLKVVIKGNGTLSPNVFRLDNRAVLDIPNVKMTASLPAAVAPIKGIRAGKHKDRTRIVLDLAEGASFDVAAVEDSVIVAFRLPEKEKTVAKAEKPAEAETKTVISMPEKPVEGRYKGQKISLDFQDADIGPIFRLLADISGYNFVIDPAVKGKITLKLMSVPWDQALDIVLQTFSLGKSIDGNIIWIAPLTTFAKMAKEKSEAKGEEERAEDLIQEIVRVNYATAGDITAAIKDAKLLSKDRGSVTMDNRMNTLIIKDTQTNINKIKELVKIMDVPKPQVMIEARIVQVTSNYSETLGIRWGGSYNVPSAWPNTLNGSFSVNTAVSAAGPSIDNPGGVLGMTVGTASTIQVQLSVQALETMKKAKTLSNPKVLTLDNEQASIQQGQSFFINTISAEGTKTEEKNATLSLQVKPKITPNGYIQLEVMAADDSLASISPPVINKKSIQTKALVKEGETLVLGGIYTSSLVEDTTGVPLLGKIPVLGWLFKTKQQTGPNIVELLIFITPTIVSKSF